MPAKPLRVVVTTTITHGGLETLRPTRQQGANPCEFLLNPPAGTDCDFWIVWAGSRDRDFMRVAPQNTLFISGEPPSKKIYPARYYAQFHHVVSTHADDPHPRVTTSMPGLNWHVGLDRETDRYTLSYDDLARLPMPPKSNRISVVCSTLTTTEGQRKRLAFLDSLKSALGDSVIHFGRGFTPIPDKLQAILPNRFHLVLENGSSPDYWSEKLSDAYLGWAYPIYIGCPNLHDFFPQNGFAAIDPDTPDASIATIRRLLTSPPSPEEIQAIHTCRSLILDDYNPFTRFTHWVKRFHQADATPQSVRITTHKAFRPFPNGTLYRLKTLFRR